MDPLEHLRKPEVASASWSADRLSSPAARYARATVRVRSPHGRKPGAEPGKQSAHRESSSGSTTLRNPGAREGRVRGHDRVDLRRSTRADVYSVRGTEFGPANRSGQPTPDTEIGIGLAVGERLRR
jgi:hypothetical protein